MEQLHPEMVESDSLKVFPGRAAMVVMDIGHLVGRYVQLAEGGDGYSRMCDVLYVSMSGKPGDHVEKLLRFVTAVRGQQHVCGECHTIPTADLHWLHKDADVP